MTWIGISGSGLALALLVLPAGCARRAPGPEECHAVATRRVGQEVRVVSRRWGRVVLEGSPEDRILELTTECLTTPYDRKLVECLGASSAVNACLAAFRARRGE